MTQMRLDIHSTETTETPMAEKAPTKKKRNARHKPKPWTKEDDRLLLALRNAGKSYDEIAGKLGRSAGSVQQRRSVIGRASEKPSGKPAKKAGKRKPKQPSADAVARSEAKLARIVGNGANGNSTHSRPDRFARVRAEPPQAAEGDAIHLTVNGVTMEIDPADAVVIENGTIRIGGTVLRIPRVLV